MKKLGVGLLVLALFAPATAGAADPDRVVVETLEEKKYSFCKTPRQPILGRRKELCSLASEISGCEGYAKACDVAEPKPPSWLGSLASALGPLAHALLYVIVVVIVLAVAIPVLRALAKRRRDKQIADVEKTPNLATVLAPPAAVPEEISDAEAALREADALRARGEHSRALALYLAASLAALDRRGAVRLARHRTNGEYVRACTEETSRQPLREIVREVDRVEFGKIPPTDDAVTAVASRASRLVRFVTLAFFAVALAGCGGAGERGSDPAGDELPQDVLRAAGFEVGPLPRALASLPIDDKPPPMVVVDVDRVTLEDESSAHLLRWVENGGVLVLFGSPSKWPKELGATSASASGRDVTIGEIRDVRLAHPAALAWKDSQTLAMVGDEPYIARKDLQRGSVVGVANGDLFTNVGMMPPVNPAALRFLFEVASDLADTREIQVARQEDGIAPPSNPFSALVAAGLLKGSAHAVLASMLLFLAYGIRQARARPAAAATRRAFTEHVEATGAFYDRTRVFAHALSAYGKFVEMRLRERIPRGTEPASFLAARSGADPDHVARVYARALAAKSDDETKGDELATIKELRTLLVKSLDAG